MLAEPLLPEPVRGIAGTIIVGLLTAFTLGGTLFMVIRPQKFPARGTYGTVGVRLLGIVGVVIFACLGWAFFFGG